jgi:hypothetical protein
MDVCLLMKDAVVNRTTAAILKESGVSCLIADDLSPVALSKIFDTERPAAVVCGAWILRPRVDPSDLAAFKTVAGRYRAVHKARLPICILYHAEDSQVPRVEELSRLAFPVKIPENAKTSDWQTALLQGLRQIDAECGLRLPVFQKKAEVKVEEGPKYSEKDFKVEYSMQAHTLMLEGPLVGRVASRIDMILKNEKVHQDVKMNGPRDKNAKRILKVDWQGVVCVSEQAGHHCFLVFKELMQNGIYEAVRFEHFLEKGPLFVNKTHFELFTNRFCSEE